MTHLWYQIKKLGLLPMDKDCERCKASLKNFKNHPLQPNEAIIIMPEENGIGGIRAFHIARVMKEHLKNTKIYKQLKEIKR